MNRPQFCRLRASALALREAQKVRKVLLCLLWLIPCPAFAASPVLAGKSIPGSVVRVIAGDGRVVVEASADKRGAFRVQVPERFHLEIYHDGYRTLRSSEVSLTPGSDDVYQVDVPLRPGTPDNVETVVLQVAQVSNQEMRADPTANEALPAIDRLFGLRGGVNVTNIKEGASQEWFAASGNVFTSSSTSTSVTRTSDFSAELGDPNAPSDSLAPGGTAFHGDVHYFGRNDALNAKNFFDPANQPIPPFKYDFFGGNAGGMIRDGTYFYSEYWGLRIGQSITRAAVVPDPVLLTGDFSSMNANPIACSDAGALCNPNTGFPFAGNRIPPEMISPQGQALAQRYPAPNVADGSVQNYRAVGKLKTGADDFGLRFDRRLSANDEAFMEYQFNRDTTDDPFNLLSGITNLPSFGVHDALQTQTLRLNNTHIFSPAVVYQLRFSASYLQQPRTILGNSTGTPAILVTDYSNLGDAPNLPQYRRNRSFEMLNDVSWQHGGSQTKFGGTIRYLPFHASMNLYSRGQYQFTDGIYTNNSLANLLLGLPSNALQLTGNTIRDFRTWTTSLYLQHQWQPRPRLSVNAGVRYDYQTPFNEAHNMAGNFDSATGQLVTSPKPLYDPDYNNFAPRVGIAWQPWGNAIVRAGYGIFYDTLSVGDSLFLLGLNPPFAHFDVRNNGPLLPDFGITDAFQSTAVSTPPSLFSTSRQLSNPYVQQWSTSISFPVRQSFTVEVSYFGQKGARLRRQVNLNQATPGDPGSLDDRRPFQGFDNIFQFETSASSIAHAAELRVDRRFKSGIGFTSSYRFSRSIDDATLISILPQDSHNLRAERGLSDFQMKHRLLFSSTYTVPGRFAPIRGWQLQAIGTLQSGTPLSAIISQDISGTGTPIVNRPNLIKNPNISHPTAARFFDPTAFQIPDAGTFGNSGRNVIIGPGTQNIDVALARSFRLSDATRAQFRTDFYNVFNHPNFVAPPSLQNFADAPDFGALFVARSPRIVQLGLKFLW
jgi:TonB dependent receptor